MFSERLSSSLRRNLRMASGLILFTYIGAHLLNHALGLISLDTAEAGMEIAVEVWYSLPGTILLYGAFATHFMMALFAVYERRTFRLPPLELLRIVLGFTMPILLIGHAASTRLAYEMFGLSSDYTRVVSNLWATGSQGWQLGLMAPGWLHGCLGLHFAFSRRWWYRQFRFVLFSAALLLPVLAALGIHRHGQGTCHQPGRGGRRRGNTSVRTTPCSGWRSRNGRTICSTGISPSSVRLSSRAKSAIWSSGGASASSRCPIRAGSCGCPGDGRCWRRAAASTCRMPRCAAAGRAARPAGSG